VDSMGMVRFIHFGEGNYKAIEAAIVHLLK